jgi:ribose 5-phosphate isomerase A
MISDEVCDLKKTVAETAVNEYIRNGMTVGLGTGSTAAFAIHRIGELVRGGLRLTCVATSVQTEKLAEAEGIHVVPLCDIDHVDVTIDGADEVDPNLQLIKGLGGALLREKIVAAATLKEVIVVDDSKLVKQLGTKVSLPIEVIPYGQNHTAYAIAKQGCEPVLRMRDGRIFVTDSGNLIYDCKFGPIDRPFFLESRLDVIPGVVENGLFLNTASVVMVSHPDGSITKMER